MRILVVSIIIRAQCRCHSSVVILLGASLPSAQQASQASAVQPARVDLGLQIDIGVAVRETSRRRVQHRVVVILVLIRILIEFHGSGRG